MQLLTLTFWAITALGGLYMLGICLRTGRPEAEATDTHFPSTLLFTHGALAVMGLGLWIIYMAWDETSLAWSSLAILLVVSALGSVMFVQWLKDRHGKGARAEANAVKLAEQQIPSSAVHAHGALAFVTIVLVVLTALGIGD